MALQSFNELSRYPHPKPGAGLVFGCEERLINLAERFGIHSGAGIGNCRAYARPFSIAPIERSAYSNGKRASRYHRIDRVCDDVRNDLTKDLPLSTGVTLHSIPGITLLCFQSFSEI
jgi:hypothetical protein